jgi:hypothetical protein
VPKPEVTSATVLRELETTPEATMCLKEVKALYAGLAEVRHPYITMLQHSGMYVTLQLLS